LEFDTNSNSTIYFYRIMDSQDKKLRENVEFRYSSKTKGLFGTTDG